MPCRSRFRFSERAQPFTLDDRDPAVCGYAWRHPSPAATVVVHGYALARVMTRYQVGISAPLNPLHGSWLPPGGPERSWTPGNALPPLDRENVLPYVWMLCGSFSFAVMSTLAHALGEELDWQVVAFSRAFLALFFALLLGLRCAPAGWMGGRLRAGDPGPARAR